MFEQIRKLYEKKDFKWRPEGRVNLFGVRTGNRVTDKFDDFIGIAFEDLAKDGGGTVFKLPATTRAGRHYFQNPMNVKGCAILPPGQYLETWAFGLHNGKYEALCQVRELTVWRDNDRDDELDPGSPDHGLFGINIHRAMAGGESNQVGPYSAGCQVIANSTDFDVMMRLLHSNADRFRNKTWDYTLFEIADFQLVAGGF